VEQLMAKIRRAVSHYKSQQEQIIGLMRIFDLDNDGMISFIELVDGIKQLGIQAKKTDVIELMNRMDVDKDGWISQKELYSGLGL
jgi:Ca2+-binding EF-hand superfamily protein